MGFFAKLKAWFDRTFPSSKAKLDADVDKITDAAKVKYAAVKDKVDDRVDLLTAEAKAKYFGAKADATQTKIDTKAAVGAKTDTDGDGITKDGTVLK